jgi:sugar lactone lactonase YvrE
MLAVISRLSACCVSAALLLSACSEGLTAPLQQPVTAQQVITIEEQPVAPTLGGHLWGNDRRDPAGTLRTPYQLPAQAQPTLLWELEFEGGLAGGPAIDRDGMIYVGTRAGDLHALNPDGKVRWTVRLPAIPVGAPALNTIGQIVIADERGGATVLGPNGAQVWRYVQPETRPAIAGPVVDLSGNVYIISDGSLLSIDPTGSPRWRASLPLAHTTPNLRIKGPHLFFKDVVISTRTGAVQLAESPEEGDQFVSGADGRMYLMNRASLLEWRTVSETNQLASVSSMDWTRAFTYENAIDALVWTPGLSWALLDDDTRSRIVWAGEQGTPLGVYDLPIRDTRVIAVGNLGEQYLCGELENERVRCDAIRPVTAVSDWSIELEVLVDDGTFGDGPMVVGGALLQDKLLIATLTGRFFALGQPGVPAVAQSGGSANADPAATPLPTSAGLFPPDPTRNATAVAALDQQSLPTVAPATVTALATAAPLPTLTTEPTTAPTPTPVPTQTPTPAATATSALGILSSQCDVLTATVMRNAPSEGAPELVTIQPDAPNPVYLIAGASGDAWVYVRVGRRLGWLPLVSLRCAGLQVPQP